MKIDKFLEIESKYDLYNKEIEGVNFWMYERFLVWNYKICSAKLNLMASQSMGKKGILEKIKKSIILLGNMIFRGKIRNQKYDICFVSHERRCKVDDHYECIYTEELSRNFANSITLEEPFELRHFKPVINKDLYYTDYVLVLGEIYSFINIHLKTKLYKKIYSQVRTEVESAINEIIEEYRVDLIPEEIYRMLTRRILIVKICRKEYYKIIKKINPKIIVEVVHYNAQNMMINEIADRLGIKTIELQHGTMDAVHAAYHYRTDAHIKQLPDVILTFSEYWNKAIHMPHNSTQIIATGFPCFETKVNKYKDKYMAHDNVTNILFLSQGTIGKDLFDLAIELSRILDKTQFHIIYKLHPAEYSDWKERYGCDRSSEIEVIDTSEIDLYELFAKCKIQVGVYSTAVYEGIGFGLRTCIYNIAHADTMQNLVDEGYAKYVNNVEELMQFIFFQDQEDVKTAESLWKSNAMDNIITVINKFL